MAADTRHAVGTRGRVEAHVLCLRALHILRLLRARRLVGQLRGRLREPVRWPHAARGAARRGDPRRNPLRRPARAAAAEPRSALQLAQLHHPGGRGAQLRAGGARRAIAAALDAKLRLHARCHHGSPPPPPRVPAAAAPPSTEPMCMGRLRSSSTSWSGHHASRSHCASPARPSSTTSEARAWSRSRGRRGSIGARGAATCACIAPGERGFSLGAPHRGQDADVGDAGGRRQLARRTGQRERDGQAGGTAAERGALATSAGRGCRCEAIRLPLNAGGGCRQRRGARRRGVRQAAPFSGAIAPSCHQACGVMRRLYGAPRAVIHQNDPSRRAAQLSEPRVAIAREPCGGNVHDTSAGAHL